MTELNANVSQNKKKVVLLPDPYKTKITENEQSHKYCCPCSQKNHENIKETAQVLTKREKLLIMELTNDHANKPEIVFNSRQKNQIKAAKSLIKKRLIVRSARSGWVAFLMDQKRETKSTDPLSVRTKLLSPIWQKMTDEEKIPYTKAYNNDKTRYQNDIACLNRSERQFLKNQRKLKRKSNRAIILKKPKTSFLIYAEKVRDSIKEEHPTLKVPQVAKMIGKQWRELSDEERNVYIDLYKKKKVEYEAKRKVFEDEELKNMMVLKNKRQKINMPVNPIEMPLQHSSSSSAKDESKFLRTNINDEDSDDEEDDNDEEILKILQKRMKEKEEANVVEN